MCPNRIPGTAGSRVLAHRDVETYRKVAGVTLATFFFVGKRSAVALLGTQTQGIGMASDRSSQPSHSVMGVILALSCALFLSACGKSSPPSPAVVPSATPLATATSAAVSATLIPHTPAGWDFCLFCHAIGQPEAVPADHAGRGNSTCTACHEWQTAASQPPRASMANAGEAIWLTRDGLSCRNCHGAHAEGGFGPPLANTGLDVDTFLLRTRSPQSSRMPPIASAPDDPIIERSGTWISDSDLLLVYDWLTGARP
jgi:hypothetical protein